MEDPEQTASGSAAWIGRLKRHRAITSIFVACIVAGAVLGYFLFTDDMSAVRRVIGGAVSGVGVALLVSATKMIG